MRLWSIHPKYLDNKRIVALWRETLLARKVLEGRTKGYKNHPQLIRFKNSDKPLELINNYLRTIYDESIIRGFNFDKERLLSHKNKKKILVSDKQLFYEINHLNKKLKIPITKKFFIPKPNDLFSVIPGEIEPWEKTK